MDNFKSTKFVGTMAVILLAYGLVFTGKLDAKTWLDMAIAGVGIYGGLNVVQKFAPPAV